MTILGIETSCDDTGMAILKVSGKKRPVFNILSNVVSSQIKVHAKYGGVVPNLAAREHLRNIEPCLKKAFQETNLKPSNIDLIAVTIGPGLIPSLLIGVHFAKTLAYVWKKPIIGVNHIEAHIAAALISSGRGISNSKFLISKTPLPAISLVVSGGHTQLILMKKIGDYKIIGETRDDAAGECFDKIAKLLRLGYPGGPAIAAQAAKFQISKSKFQTNSKSPISKLPRPMIKHKNYDFSFSGLKTAVLYLLKDLDVGRATSHITSYIIPELCAETQQAIIDVLIDKTLRAAQEYKAKTIILSGGVAANDELRKQFAKKIRVTDYGLGVTNLLVPPKNLCTDNGAMIAMAGYFNKQKATKNYNKIKADANLRIQ